MSFLCGKTCECKKRCSSWFPNSKDYREGCQDACKGNPNINSAQEYLNTTAIGQQQNQNNQQVQQASNQLSQLMDLNNERTKQILKYTIAAVLILLVVIIIIKLLKRK